MGMTGQITGALPGEGTAAPNRGPLARIRVFSKKLLRRRRASICRSWTGKGQADRATDCAGMTGRFTGASPGEGAAAPNGGGR